MKGTFERLLDIIDVDYIEQEPYTTLELIKGLVSDLNHYKDVVQLQREELILSKSIIESMKD